MRKNMIGPWLLCLLATACESADRLPMDRSMETEAVAPGWSATREDSGALAGYVARPDTSFAWRKTGAGRIGSTSYVELLMTSQTWRGTPWRHQLFLLRPASMRSDSRQAMLG